MNEWQIYSRRLRCLNVINLLSKNYVPTKHYLIILAAWMTDISTVGRSLSVLWCWQIEPPIPSLQFSVVCHFPSGFLTCLWLPGFLFLKNSGNFGLYTGLKFNNYGFLLIWNWCVCTSISTFCAAYEIIKVVCVCPSAPLDFFFKSLQDQSGITADRGIMLV